MHDEIFIYRTPAVAGNPGLQTQRLNKHCAYRNPVLYSPYVGQSQKRLAV
jgi:hypothetical protein